MRLLHPLRSAHTIAETLEVVPLASARSVDAVSLGDVFLMRGMPGLGSAVLKTNSMLETVAATGAAPATKTPTIEVVVLENAANVSLPLECSVPAKTAAVKMTALETCAWLFAPRALD